MIILFSYESVNMRLIQYTVNVVNKMLFCESEIVMMS